MAEIRIPHQYNAEHLMRREEIVGTWRLVSYVARNDSDRRLTYPLGTDAVGLLIYAADGYMSAQLMRAARDNYALPDIAGGTTEQGAAAAEGYLAYGGLYDVDESTRVVRHQVTVSLLPNWIHTMQLRHGTLAGNRLTLVAEERWENTTIHSTLVCARAR